MANGIEDFQKFGKEGVDTALASFGVVTKGFQAIAVELADYSKKSFEDGSATLEKLIGAKTLDKAVEVQNAYFKSSYEGFVSQASKISEMYVDIAKDVYKPFEGIIGKVGK